MIKTYTINDYEETQGLFQLVISPSDIREDGSFYAYEIGTIDSPFKLQGFTFIIDENTVNQIEKVKVRMEGFNPILEVKDGEIFEDKAYLNSVELNIKLLEEQLAKEKAKINEQL